MCILNLSFKRLVPATGCQSVLNVSPALRSGVPSEPSGGGCVGDETRGWDGTPGSAPRFLENIVIAIIHKTLQRNSGSTYCRSAFQIQSCVVHTFCILYVRIRCMLCYLYVTEGAVRGFAFVLSSAACFCFLRITSWSFCFTKELATAPVNQRQ